MANIKDLKKKIKSTKGTLKITSAMKLVSAAKFNRAQQAVTNARPYASELDGIVKAASALVEGYSHEFLVSKSNSSKIAVLLISSNKGLCGGFNTQIIKAARNFVGKNKDLYKFYFVGKKAKDVLGKEVNVEKLYKFQRAEPSYPEVKAVAKELSELFKSGEVSEVLIAYNVFRSVISFTPTIKRILPISLDEKEKEKLKAEFPFDFLYEPNAKELLDALIPELFVSSIYTAVLDAYAAEQGSRMSAMDSASKNCKEAIRTKTLLMNKLRQAAITKELIEVVSGAQALQG